MNPLAGHRVAVLGGMGERALARILASFGAELGGPVEGASFVIDDIGLDGLGDVAIPAQAVHVSVTSFGSGGPHARWRGSELIASAMGGALRVTGEPGLPPVKEAGDACTFHADMVAASGALAAHYARGTHGHGQHVDVSVQQVAFSRNFNGVLVWQFDRRKLARVGDREQFAAGCRRRGLRLRQLCLGIEAVRDTVTDELFGVGTQGHRILSDAAGDVELDELCISAGDPGRQNETSLFDLERRGIGVGQRRTDACASPSPQIKVKSDPYIGPTGVVPAPRHEFGRYAVIVALLDDASRRLSHSCR